MINNYLIFGTDHFYSNEAILTYFSLHHHYRLWYQRPINAHGHIAASHC